MKRFLLLIAAAFAVSCSSDGGSDSPDIPDNDLWNFKYRSECGGGVAGSFCVTEAEYNEAMETKYWVNETCFKIRIMNPEGELEFYTFHSASKGCD